MLPVFAMLVRQTAG